ncbi:hypothetical protein CKA32_006439 [Geitlerinema sp. FC II]|nr:hypothetical protein CKA32_006439 [Geitlerinema sp. FC II]
MGPLALTIRDRANLLCYFNYRPSAAENLGKITENHRSIPRQNIRKTRLEFEGN